LAGYNLKTDLTVPARSGASVCGRPIARHDPRADVGEVFISAEDGKVVKTDLHIDRVDDRSVAMNQTTSGDPLDYDVVIAGGALAGAATAILLLREQPGLRVLVVENRRRLAVASARPRSKSAAISSVAFSA